MGQYHAIYNKTKKEYISFGGAKLWEKAFCTPHSMALLVLLSNSNDRGGGDLNNPIYADTHTFRGDKRVKRKKPQYKRWSNEKQKYIKCTSAEYNEIQLALNAISGRWAGDEIVVQGDYANEKDPAYISKDEFRSYRSINKLVVDAFLAVLKDEEDDESVQFKQTLKFELEYL